MIFAVAPFGRAAANRTASSWKQTCAPENGAALGRRTRSGPRLPVAVHATPSVRLLAGRASRCLRSHRLRRSSRADVLTHDSIGRGEDGPMHQPVEHFAMLRATPNLHVFRPCDAVETAECWELVLAAKNRPSALLLSRQNLPTVRDSAETNESARGAYVLSEADGQRDVTLLATGSEVSIAIEAAKALRSEGKRVAVVSMPSWDLFEAQPASYRAKVLGSAPRRPHPISIAISASPRMRSSRRRNR